MTTKEMTRPAAGQAPQQKPAQTPRRYNPFDALQEEIDSVFDRFNGFGNLPAPFAGFWKTRAADQVFIPPMEVTETDGAIEVATELPGIDEKDIEISVSDGVLTIRGEKNFEKDEKKKSYRLVERSYGSFERAVALPPGVDASKVKATMTKGVLKVEIPRPVGAKTQQVKINAE